MKLKTIMYALAYGRSPEALKRSEGACRVKLNEESEYEITT